MSDQPIIQQMLDKLLPQLNTPPPPPNPVYLPDIIKPTYDPDNVGKLDLGTLTGQGGTQAARNLCKSVASTQGQMGIPVPGALPTLVLGSVSQQPVIATGLSNVKVTSLVSGGSDGHTITAQAAFGTLTLAGSFTLTQQCCYTQDLKSCSASMPLQVGTGTFTATIPSPTATIVFQITQIAQGVLTIAAQSAALAAATSFNITVDITSVPPDLRQAWNQYAEEALSNSGTQASIVTSLNQFLNDPSRLSGLSATITQKVDDYLKQNHMYPFNGSFLSLF
jgi:hypothetical protein